MTAFFQAGKENRHLKTSNLEVLNLGTIAFPLHRVIYEFSIAAWRAIATQPSANCDRRN